MGTFDAVRYPEKIAAIGMNIQKLRKSKGLSQYKLAAEAEIERKVLQRIEYGEGSINLNTLIAITMALGVRIEEIFEGVFSESESQ